MILYDTGHALIASGNYTDAVLAFDHATAIEPGYFEAWNEKADALNRAKQYNDALEASDQTVLINPNYVQGWINRGYILYNLGRYDDELKAYERARSIRQVPKHGLTGDMRWQPWAGTTKRYNHSTASQNSITGTRTSRQTAILLKKTVMPARHLS